MTADPTLFQLTDQPDFATTKPDNEGIAEPMPIKSELDHALAVLLCTTEGTHGIAEEGGLATL